MNEVDPVGDNKSLKKPSMISSSSKEKSFNPLYSEARQNVNDIMDSMLIAKKAENSGEPILAIEEFFYDIKGKLGIEIEKLRTNNNGEYIDEALDIAQTLDNSTFRGREDVEILLGKLDDTMQFIDNNQ